VLTPEEIRQALHAARVVPVAIANPHGPLGLEQLAAVVEQIREEGRQARVERPISVSLETWEKPRRLAQAAAPGDRRQLTASEVAAALLERAVDSCPPAA
jgi:hypothetical protein